MISYHVFKHIRSAKSDRILEKFEDILVLSVLDLRPKVIDMTLIGFWWSRSHLCVVSHCLLCLGH